MNFKTIRKAALFLLLTLCAVAGPLPGGAITARAANWPGKANNVYSITAGGTYDCPSSLDAQVKISGGTESNPVIINISGAVNFPYLSNRPTVPPFVVKSGYVQIIGKDGATLLCPKANAINAASSLVGDANVEVSNIVIDGQNSGTSNLVNIGSSTYSLTCNFENVTLENWVCPASGGAIYLKSGT